LEELTELPSPPIAGLQGRRGGRQKMGKREDGEERKVKDP